MRLSAVLLAASLSLPALAHDVPKPGADWEEANHTDDLVVFTKDVPKGRKIIAVGDVDASPEAVSKVVGDFSHYPDFMPYVKEAKIVSRKSDNEFVAYTLLSPPLVDDRDYAIKVTAAPGTAQNGGVFTTAWTAVPEAEPARADVVRVTLNDGEWRMEPLDGGKRTKLTYTLLTHPGGSIPNWVANKSNTKAIPDLFAAIRKRATKK